MKKKNILKGVLFVGIGASIYGMLATFVKMAYHEGYTTSEVTTSQFMLGLVGLLILNFIQTITSKQKLSSPNSEEVRMLLLAGTSLGCTSLFYYIAVQYINVSIAIVLLMQSVWFSVVAESFLKKKFPNERKIFSTIVVLLGTVLATNLINMDLNMDWHGVFWGLLAAISYTITMFTSNTIATHLPVFRKSIIMLSGGAIIIFIFLFLAQIGPFYFESLTYSFFRLLHILDIWFDFSTLWHHYSTSFV
jgi:drug/metabolite transporter (DMT)-like permease